MNEGYNLEFIIAEHIGFCFGVSRAVDIAIETSEQNEIAVTYGDIIHNPQVVEYLKLKGITSNSNLDQITSATKLIIRSHGVVPEVYEICDEKGIHVVDATCPYVSRIQKKAKYCFENDIQLIVFGEASHPEIIGINGWYKNKAIVITNIDDANQLDKINKAVIVAQTTANRLLWNEVVEIAKTKVDDLEVFDSICESTILRQSEADRISKDSDIILVIGGKQSSNTKKLYDVCKKNCNNTYHIENIDEIKKINFKNTSKVGIISGTSTPDWIIKEGIRAMSDLNKTTETNDQPLEEKQDIAEEKKKEKVEVKVEDKVEVKEIVEEAPKKTKKTTKAKKKTEEVVVEVKEEIKEEVIEETTSATTEKASKDADSVEVTTVVPIVTEEDTVGSTDSVEETTDAPTAIEEDTVEATDSVEEKKDTETVSEEVPAEVVEEDSSDKNDDEADLQKSFMDDVDKSMVQIKTGMILKGKVVTVNNEEVCVNIGYKADGIVTKQEFSNDQDIVLSESCKEGDEFEVEVLRVRDEDGNVLLSRKNVESRQHWQELIDTYEEQEYYDCIGKQVVKGGLIATIKGIRAFIPASHLDVRYVNDITEYVGKQMKVKIIEIEKHRHRVVASRKQYILDEEKRNKSELWGAIEEGSTVRGVVRRLTDFGAFVDIGGIDGLVHVTDLAWGRVNHPRDIVSTNEEIDVVVLKVDIERERISLGYKQTLPKPWDVADEKYPIGSIITGKVVRIVPFGAFVELEPGLDGLIHISQVASQRIEKVEDVLELNQEIEVKVLDINAETRRISLSIRAITDPEGGGDEEYHEEDAHSVLVDTSKYE